MTKTYKIDVDCANCAAKMEMAASKLDGVSEIGINFITQKLTVTFADGADIASVQKQILKACRKFERGCEIEW